MLIDVLLQSINQSDVKTGLLTVVLLCALRISTTFVEELSKTFLKLKSNNYIHHFNKNLASYLVRSELQVLDKHLKSDDLHQSIIDNLSLPQQAISVLFSLSTLFIRLLILTAVLFYINELVGLSVLFCVLASYLLVFRHKTSNQKIEQRIVRSQSIYLNQAFESIDHREGIRSVGATKLILNSLFRTLKRYITFQKKIIGKDFVLSMLNTFSVNLIFAVVLVMSVLLASKGILSISDALSCIFLSSVITPSILMIFSHIIEIDRLSARIKTLKISEYIGFHENDSSLIRTYDNNVKSIELKSVDFKYEQSSKSILKNLNLTLSNDSPVAFVGKSGLGKSTLAKLIAGIYIQDSGNIKFYRDRFGEIKKEKLKIVIVPQKPFIFSASLRRNLVLTQNGIADEELIEILKKVQLEGKLLENKGILDESLKSHEFSVGELQRLNIARALLQKPDIIIYDEPTSSLDYFTENKISQLINEFSKFMFVIIIAHRLHTLSGCAQVVFFSTADGVFKGEHDNLLSSSDEYAELFKFSSF